MYQARRSEKLTDTLQLIDKSGNVVHNLKIEVDIDAISGGFRKTLDKLYDAEKRLKKNQRKGDAAAFDKAYEDYGKTLTEMFYTTFDAKNAQTIIDFYENNYVEMSVEMVPYIIDVLIPLIEGSINRQKKRLKNAARRRWNK